MTLGEKIRILRQDGGITQTQLARRLGVSPSAVGNWEQGLNNPSLDLVGQMCVIFGVAPNCFFDEIPGAVPEKGSSEEELLRKYRALDAHGKRMAEFCINEEYAHLQTQRREHVRLSVAARHGQAGTVSLPDNFDPARAKSETEI